MLIVYGARGNIDIRGREWRDGGSRGDNRYTNKEQP
jgi:hypothetical protein